MIRVERFMGIGPKHHVAVVVTDRAGAFIVHEVARHILPLRLEGTADARHELEAYAEIERAIKSRLL